jgi:hypothetical protein
MPKLSVPYPGELQQSVASETQERARDFTIHTSSKVAYDEACTRNEILSEEIEALEGRLTELKKVRAASQAVISIFENQSTMPSNLPSGDHI